MVVTIQKLSSNIYACHLYVHAIFILPLDWDPYTSACHKAYTEIRNNDNKVYLKNIGKRKCKKKALKY
jgi:hypothetical protein